MSERSEVSSIASTRQENQGTALAPEHLGCLRMSSYSSEYMNDVITI